MAEQQQEQQIRVRIPRKEENEILGIIEQMLEQVGLELDA